jgi:hypothetical protein
MILPPGGFLMLGLILFFFSWLEQRNRDRRAQARAVRDQHLAGGV